MNTLPEDQEKLLQPSSFFSSKEDEKACHRWILTTAYSYIQQRLSAEAVTLLEALRAIAPGIRQGLLMLVYAYLLEKKYERVLQESDDLFKGAAKEPQLHVLHLFRSHAFFALGNQEAAKMEHIKYLRFMPNRKA